MPILCLIRHGETDFNVAKRLQGHYDTALNARGQQQASDCGEVLRDLFARDGRAYDDFTYISSPLTRARQTMEGVLVALGLDPRAYSTDARLMEICYGEWEGLTLPEIQARDPDALRRREHDKWGFEPPGGESLRAVAGRVGEWYGALTQDTVVTAHGGVGRALMANFHILPEEKAIHADVSHGVVYVFSGDTLARYA